VRLNEHSLCSATFQHGRQGHVGHSHAAHPESPHRGCAVLHSRQAARAIENHRKGDATIRFVRKGGTPADGLNFETVQRTHDVAFGNLFRPRHYTNKIYRARFLEVFNFIQFLEFNWGQYERDEGQPRLAELRPPWPPPAEWPPASAPVPLRRGTPRSVDDVSGGGAA
jgi:hypothetical protein